MPDDEDLPKRIEAVFERSGLGNSDPEQISGFLDRYDSAMASADRLRARKGRNFEEILESTPEGSFDEES
jgi:hypothetical protein